MTITCACGHEYATVQEPCPDGREGCLVNHTLRSSYVCSKCGADNVPNLSKGVTETIGIGMFNPRGLEKLELYSGNTFEGGSTEGAEAPKGMAPIKIKHEYEVLPDIELSPEESARFEAAVEQAERDIAAGRKAFYVDRGPKK